MSEKVNQPNTEAAASS